MNDEYTLQILRVVVAQICQTIGWHSIQSTPLELLVDILHKYLRQISRETYRYTELYGRIEPNLDDVGLAFRHLGINIPDIEEYINYVDPVSFAFDVPKYPVHKDSSLNFLKPGSKEVLTRPVHINEYLPPIYPEKETEQQIIEPPESSDNSVDVVTIASNENGIFKKPDILASPVGKKTRVPFEEEGRPTREISSVMMTSSGFISPAREGKLPDSKTPILPEYKPVVQSPPPILNTALPVSSLDSKFDKKTKKKSVIGGEKDRKRDKPYTKDKKAQGSATELPLPEKTKGLGKKIKSKQKHKEHSTVTHHLVMDGGPARPPLTFAELTAKLESGSSNTPVIQVPVPALTTQIDPKIMSLVKLSSEPDKQKLNIFKKIPSAKKEKDDFSKSPNIFSENPLPPLTLDVNPLPNTGSIPKQSINNESSIIIVDDEPDTKPPYTQMNLLAPVRNMQSLPGPGGGGASRLPPVMMKHHGQKKPRKKLQMQHQLEQALPLNLTNEMPENYAGAVNMVKKDHIKLNARLPFPQGLNPMNATAGRPPIQNLNRIQKEKKERKKPKVRENKKQQQLLLQQQQQLQLSQQAQNFRSLQSPSTPGRRNFNLPMFVDKQQQNINNDEQQHPQFLSDKDMVGKNQIMLDMDGSLKLPPYVTPNLPTMPMFPFYAFPPRPGLIPTTGLFPPLPPMSDNPAFSKYLSMMRFNNFNNAAKVSRMSSSFDNDPPPPPPIDVDKAYCNVAPLVPESMKFQLSPTKTISKKQSTNTSSASTVVTDTVMDANTTQISKSPKFLDAPIEISDDERRKSDSDEKNTNEQRSPPSSNVPSVSGISVGNISIAGGGSSAGAGSSNSNIDTNINNASKIVNSGNNSTNTVQRISSEEVNKIDDDDADIIASDHDERAASGGGGVGAGDDKTERKKDREHKKGKRGKDGKIKKKKDKKDKSRSKEKAEKRKDREEKKDKIKKLKKEKKKEKVRALATLNSDEDNRPESNVNEYIESSTVPKLTLKFGIGSSPQPDSPDGRKISFKSHSNDDDVASDDVLSVRVLPDSHREPSPELARISPLVTRPPKQKPNSKDKTSDNEVCPVTSATPSTPVSRGPGRPRGSGNNHSGSSNAVSSTSGNQFAASNNLSAATTCVNQAVHSTDAEGNQVWICPACGRVDDGTPMIGCDGCDAWYHWVCVGIQVPPDDSEDWYCRVCIAKKQEAHGSDKKRKRKKKNKAN